MQLVYQKKISICLNRGRKGSVGNDNVLDLNNAERPQVTKGLEKKTTFEAWVKCVAVLLAQQLTPRKCRLCSLGRRLQKFPEQKQLNYLLMYAVLVRDKKIDLKSVWKNSRNSEGVLNNSAYWSTWLSAWNRYILKELHKDQILRGIGFRYSEHHNAIWQTTPTRPAFSLTHNILDLIHSKRSLHRFPFFVYLVSIIYFYFYSPQGFIPFYRLLLITIDCY